MSSLHINMYFKEWMSWCHKSRLKQNVSEMNWWLIISANHHLPSSWSMAHTELQYLHWQQVVDKLLSFLEVTLYYINFLKPLQAFLLLKVFGYTCLDWCLQIKCLFECKDSIKKRWVALHIRFYLWTMIKSDEIKR